MQEEKTINNRNREKEKKIYSPMRTLFRLTHNSKNSILNTLERKRKQPISSIFPQKNNRLNKVSSTGKINGIKYNSKEFPQKKFNSPFIDNKDNQIFNYFNNNYNNTIYNINMFNEHFNEDKKNMDLNKNIINTNRDIKKANVNNYVKKKFKNISKKKKEELVKDYKSKIDYNNDESNNESIPSGVFKYQIIKNNRNKKKPSNYISKKLHNKDKQNIKSKIFPKQNIQEIDMQYTNRGLAHYYYFDDNQNVDTNNNQNFITLNNNENNLNNAFFIEKNKKEDFYMNENGCTIRNTNNLLSPNCDVIFNMKKQNAKIVNNTLVNTKKIPSNMIYSPKRALARVYSQENMQSKDKDSEQINPLSENRIINKNKSVKDITGKKRFTYSKKLNIYKTRNFINTNKKRDLQDETNENMSQNKLLNQINYNSCYNNDYAFDNESNINNNNCNIMTNRQDNNYFEEIKYDIKPDIYPEIKINLRKTKKNKNRNKSAIIENNSKYNINSDDNDTYRKIVYQNNNYLYNKNINNSMDDNLYNIKNKNDNSMNYNINKSNIISKTNLSLSNNSISDNDINSNRYLNYNNRDKKFSIKGLYYILVFEEKIKDIADSLMLENIENIQNYCFELINYNYNFNLNEYIHNSVSDIMDMNDVILFNKYNLISIMILYELTFDEKIFMNVKILVKEMIKLMYSNIILIIIYSKNKINNSEENNLILNNIIDNLQNKYIHNKELYMDDSEYLLMDDNANNCCDEKINYNINFIIRNIHTIINNIKNKKNYNLFLNLFKNIYDISMEEINQFFRNKILKINIINSPFLSNELLTNNPKNKGAKAGIPYITKPNNKNYSLVVSLDDTLIHFKKGSIKNNKGVVQIRPGLSEFFNAVKPYYEIIVFNCGNKKYNDLILNSIDNKNIYIDYRLNRDHCIIIENDYVKDITNIGRDINKIIIVDNIPQNYRLNKDNGIYIKSFYGDPNDKVLVYLSKILVNIAKNGGDVREGIKKYWNEIINKINSNIFVNYCCK